jgi:hypothetical protein
MADAIPVSGKKRAVVIAHEPTPAPVSTPLDKFPESIRPAAEAALAAGKKVELTRKGFLRIYAD